MDSHALPDKRRQLIDLIFAKLSLVYGREFLSRWEGQNLVEVRADWQHELGQILDHPKAVSHALQHLPIERPPTVLQFRALCISRPGESPLALPMPPATAEQKLAVRSLLQQARERISTQAKGAA